jgi:hypothetical protein
MDGAAFLVVILSSGYLYATTLYVSKFSLARDTGHSLYFKTAIYAVFLFICSLLIRISLLRFESYISFEEALLDILPSDSTTSGNRANLLVVVALYSAILSLFLPLVLNLLPRFSTRIRNRVVKEAITDNEFEILIYWAVLNTKLLSVTMENKKFYIGWCDNLPNPTKPREWLLLLPLFSGIRDPDTMRLVFTTDYLSVYDEIISEDDSDYQKDEHYINSKKIKDFRICLPANKISCINVFNLDSYEKFKSQYEEDFVNNSDKDNSQNEKETAEVKPVES